MKRAKELTEQAKTRAQKIEMLLCKQYPHPQIALRFENPLQLLIAVMLSAQCTDERVNTVTPALFKKYTKADDFAMADQKVLETEIHSTGFFRNKAKNIIACCKVLVSKHNGMVPHTMEELLALSGVGRKTANCILGGAFGIPSGVVVDTHVRRVSNRLELSGEKNPERIEKDLMGLIRKKDWIHFGNALVLHGRNICRARNPRCHDCSLSGLCPSVQ